MSVGCRLFCANTHASCLFLKWLDPFVFNKTIKAHLKRLRWEWGGLSPSVSISRTSWLSLAERCISIQNITLNVRCVLTDYNLGIHKETTSELRGITILHLMHTQPKCQIQGLKACCINHHAPRTLRLLLYIMTINSDRYLHACGMNISLYYHVDRKE